MPLAPSFRAPPEEPEPIATKSWNDARAPIVRLLRWNISNASALSTLIKNLGGGGGGGGGTPGADSGLGLHPFFLMGG